MITWQIAALAAVIGYLVGSISFARIVVKLVAPDTKLTGIDLGAAGDGRQVDAISGTAVSIALSPKYGGVTAILDILKVVIPSLVFRLTYPEFPYFLITAAAGLLGHNWPIYYRFRGGRGLSPIYGGFLVLDFWGTLITACLGMVLGIGLKMVFISYLAGLWLMIPWTWFRTHNPAYLVYVLFVNFVFFLAILPDIRETARRRRSGEAKDFSESMDLTPMGKMIGRIATRAGLMKKEHDATPPNAAL